MLASLTEDQIKHGQHDEPTISDPFALRSLEDELGISKTEISASIQRSVASNLAIKSGGRAKANRRNLIEFVQYGLKYVFPAKPGAPQRGIATSFAAPMLEGKLVSSGADIYVWPHPEGSWRGLSIAPLFKSVPYAALKDARLYELLALIDAIRTALIRDDVVLREINRWRQRAFEQAECLRCVYFIAWDREACGCDGGARTFSGTAALAMSGRA